MPGTSPSDSTPESSSPAAAPLSFEDDRPSPEQGWASVDTPSQFSASSPEPIESFSPAETAPAAAEQDFAPASGGPTPVEATIGGGQEAWWEAPPAPPTWEETPASDAAGFPPAEAAPLASAALDNIPMDTGNAFFCGDTSFFSLNWALHAIAAQSLTGVFRCYWSRETVEVLARHGEIVLATTRDPELYCAEAPITLVNLEQSRVAEAREQQRETGRPLFVSLAQEDLILREPAAQLVQHYGQRLFAQLWTAPRVRFMFEQSESLPAYAADLPAEGDVDYWTLGTLRCVQFGELGEKADYDMASIPAYTRDGFERVQKLRLTVAEAQFASQFNGARSVAQIAKNLRLDIKFARLALFRFLALEIVECWPPASVGAKPEKRGVFGRMRRG